MAWLPFQKISTLNFRLVNTERIEFLLFQQAMIEYRLDIHVTVG